MKPHFFLMTVLFCLLLIAPESQAQQGWVRDTIHIQTIGNLWGVEFTSANAGVLVGDSAKRTTDGGKTWLPLGTAYGLYGQENSFAAVHCFDSSRWVAVGSSTFRTTDAGQTWIYDSLYVSSAVLRAVDFSGNVGMAVGMFKTIVSLTDGGAHWSILSNSFGPNELNFFGVAPVSGDIWIVVGGNNLRPSNQGVVLRTTDGGGSWDTVMYSPSRVVTAVSFANAGIGYAAGDSIYRTTNGGATWKGMSPVPVSVQGISFKDPAVGTLVGSGGKIYRTRDSGVTWVLQQSNTNLDLRAVCFLDTSRGWAVGYRGIVLRTANGGWGSPTSTSDRAAGAPDTYRLLSNYPNPFNPSTTIRYELPRTSYVTLSVCDVLGREVAVLLNDGKDAGYHSVSFDAAGLPSGMYFYRLQAGDFVSTRRMLVLK